MHYVGQPVRVQFACEKFARAWGGFARPGYCISGLRNCRGEMKKAFLIVAAIVVAMVVGWELTEYVAQLPGNMPDFLDDSIRWSLNATGAARLENTDDIETIAFLVVFAVCFALVGMAEGVLWAVVRRVRSK